MRRAVIILPVVVAMVLAGGTAFAGKPTREIVPVDVTFEDMSCGFSVLVHETGTTVRDTRQKGGETVIHESYPNFRVDLTNEGTEKSISVASPGPGTTTIHEDGSSTLVGEGPWFWTVDPRTLDPGLFLASGQFVYQTDSGGNFVSLTYSGGSFRGLCAELTG